MSEDLIIRTCAPTLAGLKTGSLFSCPCESREALLPQIRALNRRLVPKGLRCIPLSFSRERALIYLYRPGFLRQDLQNHHADALLRRQGYCTGDCGRCVSQLADRVRCSGDFPHEIGLFLGYPPEDVAGFLENRPCKYVGFWKVYGDAKAAQEKFDQFRSCTALYQSLHAQGQPLDRLIVPENFCL